MHLLDPLPYSHKSTLLSAFIVYTRIASWMIHQYVEELGCSVLRSLVVMYNLILNDDYSLVGECLKRLAQPYTE